MQLQPKTETLKSGLTLVTIPMETESVSVVLLVRVGSRDESKKINGLSHFVEHMVFKGTAKWPTTQEVNKVIDSVGGVFNAFTSQEHTGFWVKVAKQHLALGLEFLQQMIFKPLLPETELNRERGVILEEIKMRNDEPMIVAGDSFVSQVYSLTQLGQEVIGTAENIQQLQRREFLKHLKTWYQPKNMILAVAGPASAEATVRQAEKIFLDKGEEIDFRHQPAKLSFNQDKPQIQVIKKEIEQAHICLGVRTFERTNQDRYVLAVLSTILGGNTSSRLWNEIREKRGMAYYVRTSNDSYFETGYLVTQAGCAVNKAAEVIKLMVNEYEQISRKLVLNKELILAKEYLKGRLTLSFEDNQDVAEELGESLLLEGKVRILPEIIKGVEKVTQEDVLRVGKQIFKHNQLNLTVVGPKGNRAIGL